VRSQDKSTGQSKGSGIVEFENVREARLAMAQLGGSVSKALAARVRSGPAPGCTKRCADLQELDGRNIVVREDEKSFGNMGTVGGGMGMGAMGMGMGGMGALMGGMKSAGMGMGGMGGMGRGGGMRGAPGGSGVGGGGPSKPRGLDIEMPLELKAQCQVSCLPPNGSASSFLKQA
jgi:RNA recognition motif-containing protein